MWKKRLILLCLFCWCCFSAQSQDLVFRNIDWKSLDDNLNTIELNLNQLKTENNSLQTQLTNAGNLLNDQIKYSANQQIQYKTLEDNYEKLEKTTRIWKVCFLTATTVCVIETIVIVCNRGEH